MRNHKGDDLKDRTKRFALRVLRLIDEIPRGLKSDVLSKQLLRAATSVGANYRAACRAKSPADFISKLGNVEEEVDEAAYWLELISDSGVLKSAEVEKLLSEANELTAIIVTSLKSSKSHFYSPDRKAVAPALSSR